MSCLAGNLEKLFIEIYGDISKWLGTIFYNKNYNFLNATNKSKLIMVLEKLQIIISFTTFSNSLQISWPDRDPSHHILANLFSFSSTLCFSQDGVLSLKGLTKSTAHTGTEPGVSVLWDSLFVCLSLKCRAQSSDRYQILCYKYREERRGECTFLITNIYILCFK